MDVISSFIARYTREYDYYHRVASSAASQLEAALRNSGIRAIVTARAKSPSRLEAKCRQRGKEYSTEEHIADDIVDLAGVRVALYFPGDRDKVGAIVDRIFVSTRPPKFFPDESPKVPDKRFSGYSATHYLVRLKPTGQDDDSNRYTGARIEIQVASVLMHAWAEVEHDLIYKPLTGNLSEDEYATLDELNGLVLAGEIALERLQRAAERRITSEERLSNHYELAALIARRVSDQGQLRDAELGRIDVLFQLLKRLGIDTPEAIAPYVGALDSDFERRPISDQLTDQLLAEDESRYEIYQSIRREEHGSSTASNGPTTEDNLRPFLEDWVKVELSMRRLAETLGLQPKSIGGTIGILRQRGLISLEMADELNQIRRIRNHLVHGLQPLPNEEVDFARLRLRAIRDHLESAL